MLRLNVLLLAVLATAAPAERRWFGGHHNGGFNWWVGQASSYIDFGKRYHGRDNGFGACDLSKAVMPTGKSSISLLLPITNIELNKCSSTNTPPHARLRPNPLPRRHRPRHPKLHLRPAQRHRGPPRGRRRRNPLQRLLPRRRLARLAHKACSHRSRPTGAEQYRHLKPSLSEYERAPLLYRQHDAVLQHGHQFA